MGSELLAAIYALIAALSWGTGDFTGGFATRKSNIFSVTIAVQVIGLFVVPVALLLSGEPIPPIGSFIWGIAAGTIGTLGLLALYMGLANGNMGVVAPVSALIGGFVPVFIGTLTDGLPSSLKVVGFVIAFIAVWLIAWSGEKLTLNWQELRLPVAAGLSFGFFFIALDQMGSNGVWWPLLVARSFSIVLLVGLAYLFKQGGVPPRNYWHIIFIGGLFDISGNVFFVLSSQLGRVDIAAVIGSLYPAATVLLARFLLKEHLHMRQWVGIVGALTAIILISI